MLHDSETWSLTVDQAKPPAIVVVQQEGHDQTDLQYQATVK